jgi:TRAP transporter TAXI family solute receptor
MAIEIWSNPLGTAGYVMSFALADILTRYSDGRFVATGVESKGFVVNHFHLLDHPEARGHTIIYSLNIGVDKHMMGMHPFDEPYDGFKYIALTGYIVCGLVSASPHITEIEDLVGKRVAVGHKGHSTEWANRYILHYGYGIWAQLKPSFLPFAGARDALLGGKVDVAHIAVVIISPEGGWVGVPASEELLTVERTYLISYSEEALARTREKTGIGLFPLSVLPREVGKTPAQPWTGFAITTAWMVHRDMPDEIVYEIVRVIYENAHRFADYHITGKGLTRETIARVFAPRDMFHPAAIRFYEARDVKVGVEE